MKTAGRPTELPPMDAALPDTSSPIVSSPNATSPAVSRARASARPRRWPIKIADAYLLRHVAEATVRGLFWFAGLLMMVTVITAVQRVVNQSLNWVGVFQLLATELPRVFVFTLPMSVLYGTVQTFADLSSKG
ncbi:MAG TPA: LptF/LptG family permease, partial [Abditibacteriaceae bacterium]|nr:LptF/LptG family permease [Abditibacteriaceae bacterium]